MESPDYKVVEISDVSDISIEKELNVWTGEGYSFESIHFVTREGSRRPTMAYLFFTRNKRCVEGSDERKV